LNDAVIGTASPSQENAYGRKPKSWYLALSGTSSNERLGKLRLPRI
jgi:hypothetical protein